MMGEYPNCDIHLFGGWPQNYLQSSLTPATCPNIVTTGSGGGDVFTEPLRTFFVTTRSSMKSPIFRRLDVELRDKREAMLKELGWDVTDEERQQCISNII